MAQMRPVARNITVKPVVPMAYGVSRRTLSAWLKEPANDLLPLEETLQPVNCKKIPGWCLTCSDELSGEPFSSSMGSSHDHYILSTTRGFRIP